MLQLSEVYIFQTEEEMLGQGQGRGVGGGTFIVVTAQRERDFDVFGCGTGCQLHGVMRGTAERSARAGQGAGQLMHT